MAVGAGRLDHLALALAAGAHFDRDHLAEQRLAHPLHLTLASAVRAGDGAAPRLGSRTAAFRAGAVAGEVEGAGDPPNRLFEVDGPLELKVTAAPGPSPAALPGGSTSEEHVEEVEGGLEVEASTATHALSRGANAVVPLAPVGRGAHLVGLPDPVKVVRGRVIAGIAIGVVAHRQPPIGALQLGWSGLAVDAENLVEVAFGLGHRLVDGSLGRGILG